MSNMIDRVARAIYESRNGAGVRPWHLLPTAHKTPYRTDAVAVFHEMKVPTEAMVDAGLEANGYVLEIWQAMIEGAMS